MKKRAKSRLQWRMVAGLALVLVAALLVYGAKGMAGSGTEAAGKGTIKLGYVEWDDAVATTNVARVILEDKLGYKVTVTPVDAGVMWTGVAQGDFDAILAAWLPVTHQAYYEKYKDKVVKAGINLEGAKIGLVVPKYMTINSIKELNANKDKFQGRIVGIDPGAGLMRATDKAIKEYGLKLQLIESSDAAMTASLKDAVDHNEWIVVTGWVPHWMFAKWNLKFLQDPRGIYGGDETVNTVTRIGLDKDHPDAYKFLARFHWTMNDVGQVMLTIKDGKSPEDAARQWVNGHQDLVKKWLAN